MIENLPLEWAPEYLGKDFCSAFINSDYGPNNFKVIDAITASQLWNSWDNIARRGYLIVYDIDDCRTPYQLRHYMGECNIGECVIYITYNSQERYLGTELSATCVPRVILKYFSNGAGIFGTGRGEFIKYKDVILGDNFIQPIDNDYPAILCYIAHHLNPMAQVGLLLELTINDVTLDNIASNPLILG